MGSGKLYSVGGTDGDSCGACGWPGCDRARCFASPDPTHVAIEGGKVPVQISGSYGSGYKALMENGEVYAWGRFSSDRQCLGQSAYQGGPTHRLVGGGSAKVSPACS